MKIQFEADRTLNNGLESSTKATDYNLCSMMASRYSVGVMFLYFLKARMKDCTLENPHLVATSIILLLGFSPVAWVLQKQDCGIETHFRQIGIESFACVFLEHFAEVRDTHKDTFCYLIQGDVFPIVLPHKLENLFNGIGILVFMLL